MSNKIKFLCTLAIFFVAVIGFAPQAQAALTAVGPVTDPVNNGFPQFFSDENGLSLQLCLDQNPAGLCLLTPGFDPTTPPFGPIGTVASGNFPDETFYWNASADLSPVDAAGNTIRIPGRNQDIKILWFAALEQAFLSGITPGAQSIFLRSQVDIAGLVPGETYTLATPYGPMSVVADAVGGGRTRFEDIVVCNPGFPCNFAPILPATQTNVGAFLQWDNTLPAPPPGFIGDPNIPHTVSGGQGGNNTISVTGPFAGGCSDDPLICAAPINTGSTNLFSVSGQLADTVAPVITLNGVDVAPNITNITAGTAYVEAGATALDNFDGDVTANIVIDRTAIPAGVLTLPRPVGEVLTVTYTVTDKAGNVGTAARTINVVPDTVPPVVTITGNNPVNIKVGTAYVDAGATASDNVDGNITANLVVAGLPIDTAIAGAKTVTYTATDSSGLVTTVTRTVNVAQDVTAPVITILGANPASVSFGGTYTDAGATALDDFDGDRTANIVVTGLPIDTRVSGAHVITYAVTDLSANTASLTRTVNVVPDTVAPVITLNGANPLAIEQGSVYTELGATALDDVDGARTVTITGTVNTAVIGPNTITYTATDTSGNIGTVTRTVNVVTDATAPVITLNGAATMTILVNTTFTDPGATAVDNVDPTATVVTTGAVNTAIAGTYILTYTATDLAGNVSTATRTVNVTTDIVAPVITITGANPASVTVGETYTDADATALDNIDPVVTVTSTSTVNAAAIGSYTVTYTATDAAGNIATATRTVNVNAAPTPSSSGGGGGGGSRSSSNARRDDGPRNNEVISLQDQIERGLGTFDQDLRLANRDNDVRRLQNRLKNEGVFNGQATGFFGATTKQAVAEYQRRHGLATTGALDALTRAELNKTAQPGASNSGRGNNEELLNRIIALIIEILKQQRRAY